MPPRDLAAEEAVIASCLVDESVFPAIRELVAPADFVGTEHELIFAAMTRVADRGESLNTITVAHELTLRHELDAAGGIPYLTRITTDLPTAVGAEHYAAIVARDAVYRRLMSLGSTLTRLAAEGGSAPEHLIGAVEADLDALRRPAQVQRTTDIGADELQQTEFPEPRFAITGLIPEGLSIIAGAPKLGKSWLMLNCAIAVAMGGRALGQLEAQQGEVLYLALEDGRRRIKRRIKQLLGELRWPRALRIMDSLKRLDEGGTEEIEAWLSRYRSARLVVVDTLAKVRPLERRHQSAYGQDYGALAPLQSLAQRRGIAVVVVHHTNKRISDDPFEAISGTTGLTGAADGMLVLKRERGKDSGTLTVTGRDIDEEEYGLRWDGTVGSWTLLSDADQAKRSRERQEIIDLLRESGQALTPKELTEVLPGNRTYGAVKLLLWKMSKDGEIRVGKRGTYTALAESAKFTPGEQSAVTLVTGNPGNPVTEPNQNGTGPPGLLKLPELARLPGLPGLPQTHRDEGDWVLPPEPASLLPCHWCQQRAPDGRFFGLRWVCTVCAVREDDG